MRLWTSLVGPRPDPRLWGCFVLPVFILGLGLFLLQRCHTPSVVPVPMNLSKYDMDGTLIADAYHPKTREIRALKDYENRVSEPFYNAFITMHFQAARKLNITDCWICTHAPTSHKSMPLLGVPASLYDIETHADFSNVSINNVNRTVSFLLHTVIPLTPPVVCINFTRTDLPGIGPNFRNIGETDCMNTAPLRFYFKGMFLSWHTDVKEELINLTLSKGSKKNIYHLYQCIMGYVFYRACSTPPGYYFICGKKAYNWLPLHARGVCYVGKVLPATWYMNDAEFMDTQIHKIPPHILMRRELPAQGNIHETDMTIQAKEQEFKPLFTIPWVNRCCIKKAFSFIMDLADLMDNITALYDKNFVIVASELKMIKKEVLQHRLVLDYLTASQGGMCMVLGTACCNYVGNDTRAEDAIMSHIQKVQDLKNQFRAAHIETAWSGWDSLLDWINPLNWFKGLGGWFSGIFHSLLYIIGIYIFVYLMCRCLPPFCKSCSALCRTKVSEYHVARQVCPVKPNTEAYELVARYIQNVQGVAV
uniref:Uncharacterized protein n=1 Tax=Leptobrachium leishanense TaxID=445787 RepID=A0A8C5PC20_9ANUR